MKKIILLTLALAMLLTLAACGGGSTDTPSGGFADIPTSSQPDKNLDDSGSSPQVVVNIPDNGTPPDAPAPFETHPGDKGYFYVDTDDYGVFMYDTAMNPGNKAGAFGPCVEYTVFSFDERDYTSVFKKWVFDNEADAKTYSDSESSLLAIENVVYVIPTPDALPGYEGQGKEYHVNKQHKYTVWAYGGSTYLSKTDGFSELLADDAMKGKTGSMTLREAFADAGFNNLPDIPELNYDATSFILTFNRDNITKSNDANILIFEGETCVVGGDIFFYDNTERETQYRIWESIPEHTKSDYLEYLPSQTRSYGNLAYVGT